MRNIPKNEGEFEELKVQDSRFFITIAKKYTILHILFRWRGAELVYQREKTKTIHHTSEITQLFLIFSLKK